MLSQIILEIPINLICITGAFYNMAEQFDLEGHEVRPYSIVILIVWNNIKIHVLYKMIRLF